MPPVGTMARQRAHVQQQGGPVVHDPAQATHYGAPGEVVPFARASYQFAEKFFTDTWTTLTTSSGAVAATPHNITPGGYLRGVWLAVSASGGTLGSATLSADYPFSLLSGIVLEDVNGAPVVGPLTGYQLYLVNKYGGYFYDGDPTTMDEYVGTINTFFWLWIPVEIRSDGLGALANTDSRAQYRVVYSLAAGADQQGSTLTGETLPTSITVTGFVEYWAQVEDRALTGQHQELEPPGLGTTQFWSREVPTLPAGGGAATVKHNRVGNQIRAWIYDTRSGAAATTTVPANPRADIITGDPIRIRVDNRYIRVESPDLRRQRMARDYDIGPASPGVGISARDVGVLVYNFNGGLDRHPSPADESNWLPTTEATFLQLEDSTASGTGPTVEIITNDVAIKGHPEMPAEVA